MRYSTFGRRTGLRVSEFALGTANFGTAWASGADRDESKKMFDRFAEVGGTFLDTADVYQFGESESLLGEFLGSDRDHFVVASKFTQGSVANAGLMETGNSRKTLVRALDGSLRRLKTDYLDLYWAHWPDFVTPVDETIATFDNLVRAGKILHGGLSNFPAWRVARGATLAELRGTSSLIGVQFEYSLAARDAERELLPMVEGLGLGAVLYSPLGGGLLTGKYRHSDKGRMSTWKVVIQRENTPQKIAVVDALLAVADDLSVTPSQVAMSWLQQRARKATTTIMPIIGPRTVSQLEDYLTSLDVDLSDEHYDLLDQVSAPALGIPHEECQVMLHPIFGGKHADFDRFGPIP